MRSIEQAYEVPAGPTRLFMGRHTQIFAKSAAMMNNNPAVNERKRFIPFQSMIVDHLRTWISGRWSTVGVVGRPNHVKLKPTEMRITKREVIVVEPSKSETTKINERIKDYEQRGYAASHDDGKYTFTKVIFDREISANGDAYIIK